MDNPLPLSMDKFDRASSIDTTVPNRPINGAVEDTIDRVVNPLLATLIALPLATENMALLGINTLFTYGNSREFSSTVDILPRYSFLVNSSL